MGRRSKGGGLTAPPYKTNTPTLIVIMESEMTASQQKKLDTIIAKIEVLQNQPRLSQKETDALRNAKSLLIAILK